MNGTEAPPKTTFYGMYDRSLGFDGKGPFFLPPRYLERRDKVNLSTPLNFVCTCDTTGGSSGSPIVNKEGELVGVIFDGNIESLVGDDVYNEANNRSVAVHAAAIIEALRNLYDAATLIKEITNYE
jgi:V8-like Glu-specific endopeptidase